MSAGSYFTERFADHTEEGYVTRVRTSKIKAEDLEPMTVVEFSLTHDVRKSFEETLKPYVDQGIRRPNFQELAAIVDAHMPEEIMGQLQEFSHSEKARTVFVVHNLPQRDAGKNIPSGYEVESREPEGMVAHSYVACIQFGLAERLELTKRKPLYTSMVARKHDSERVTGSGFHNHPEDIHLFGVMYVDERLNEAPPTNFLDLPALLGEAAENHDLREIPLFSFIAI